MKRLALAAALLAASALVAGAASAQSIVTDTAPAPAWTGPYVGLDLGYVHGTGHDKSATPSSLSASGFTGGVEVGNLWQVSPHFYLGLMADARGLMPVRGKTAPRVVCPAVYCGTDITETDSVSFNMLTTARLVAAVAPWQRTLFSVSFGGAYADVSTGYHSSDGFGAKQHQATFGWAVGARGEYAFTRTLSAGLDFVYASMNGDGYEYGGGGYHYNPPQQTVDGYIIGVVLGWRNNIL